MDDEGDLYCPYFRFKPPIVVENEFCTLTCSYIVLPKGRSDLSEDQCKDQVTKLFNLVIGQMKRKLNSRYRQTPWPKFVQGDPFVEEHTRKLMEAELKTSLSDVMTTSQGLEIATNAFCGTKTKRRLWEWLRMRSKRHSLDLQQLATENGDEISFDFSNISREILDQLVEDYHRTYDNHWVFQMDSIVTLNVMWIFQRGDCLCVAAERVDLFNLLPDIFVMDARVGMKAVEPSLCLAETCVIHVAEELYTRSKETKEDQEGSITVETLQIPATLVARVLERYRHFKAKVDLYLEKKEEAVLAADNEGSDEEGKESAE